MHPIEWAKTHPKTAAAVVAVIVVGLYLLLRGNSAAPAASAVTSTGTDPAAAAAYAQTTAAQLAAGVATTQSNNQLALGLASITGAESIAGVKAGEDTVLAGYMRDIQLAGITSQTTIASNATNAQVRLADISANTQTHIIDTITGSNVAMASLAAIGSTHVVGASAYDVESSLHSAILNLQSDPHNPANAVAVARWTQVAETTPGVDQGTLQQIKAALPAFGVPA